VGKEFGFHSRRDGVPIITALRIRFGRFVFDAGTRQLLEDGRARPLSPKAFDLLGALLARRPQVVSGQELLALLWPGTFVVRTSVARLVNEVRQALGDDPRQPSFLRTVHRVGYAFAGEAVTEGVAEAPAAPPSGFALRWGPLSIPLAEGDNLLGRATDSAVSIPSRKVSRRHARIRIDGARAVLEDLESRNGTFVGARRIERPTLLVDGDEITIGPAVLVFVSGAGEGPTQED
jgi:DNA-binding winged helix-turn-helix (wHTH) protein